MRVILEFPDTDYERFKALGDRLGSATRKTTGRPGRFAAVATARDLMAIVELVERDYPGIVRQALPATEHDNGSSQ